MVQCRWISGVPSHRSGLGSRESTKPMERGRTSVPDLQDELSVFGTAEVSQVVKVVDETRIIEVAFGSEFVEVIRSG